MTDVQATVKQRPVTQTDRDAMLFKHPLEGKFKELSRTYVGPGMYISDRQQIFEVYRWEHEGRVKIYDVRKIKDAIYKGTVECICLVMTLNDQWVNHMFEYAGCEQARIDAVTAEDIKRPQIGFWYDDGLQIIDGSHRLVARYRRFKKKTAHIITLPGEIDATFLIPPEEFNPIR